MTENEKARFDRALRTGNRYIANAQKKLGLSNQNVAWIRSTGTHNENIRLYPKDYRPMQPADTSRFGDAQVSRRVYMGLNEG